MRYNNLSSYFRDKYGRRLSKICIDGGFSCPNRDGKCGTGGCIFCGERGAGEHIDPTLSIREQVEGALSRAKEGELFVAYFQNFTNTYAPLDVLRERYDAALLDERIRVLAIGTRPDCIDGEIAELIASYRERVDVWVELGLQTASDETGKVINRGYTKDTFERAVRILESYSIPVCVHLIIGLPGEGDSHIKDTVEYLSRFKIQGVKIHSIYVAKGTALEAMYREKLYTPPTEEEFLRRAVYIITHLSPEVIIHRLTGDCPADMLVAPLWNSDKHALIEKINKCLADGGLYQGIYYKEAAKQDLTY